MVNDPREVMRDLATAFTAAGIPFALIGGLALGPRGFPRATIDVDFLIDTRSLARAHDVMRQQDAKIVVEGEEFSSYLVSGIRADLQHAQRAITRSMLERADPIDFNGMAIPVVRTEDLIGLKVQAYFNNHRRVKDCIDIHELINANWSTLNFQRVHDYYALFGLERDLDDILRLVAQDHA